MIWNIAHQIVKGLPGLGQFGTLRNSVEQGSTHRVFEVTNLKTQRGLADAYAFRRPGEILLGGDREEIPDVTQFHGYWEPIKNRNHIQ
jgi:hypothetical protein